MVALLAVFVVRAESTSEHQTGLSKANSTWPTGRTVRRFVAVNQFHLPASFNAADAVNFARSVDMLSENDPELDRWFPAMRAANPHLIILKYVSGTTAHAGQSLPASEYLHGADGSLCEQRHFHNVVMNIRNPEWVASRVALAKTPGFDGAFLDVMGVAPVTKGYLSCIPIEPATGKQYTPADWLRDTSAEARTIKRALGSAVVLSNGLGNGTAFYNRSASTSLLLSTSDGALAEAWMRDARSPATSFPSISGWMDDWRMLNDGEERAIVGMVKLWGAATPDQIDQWHRFSLATFLLGASPSSYYDFIGGNNAQANLADSPYEHVDIGAALGGPKQTTGGVWIRNFAKGIVAVNPTATPVTVATPRPAINLAGQTVTPSFSVPAYSGDILVNR